MKLAHRVRPAQFLALVASLSLAACAEEGPGPQFANDPAATRPPTQTPAAGTPAPLPTAMPVATPASVRDLLRARGAPSRLFVVSGETVWSVSSAGEATRAFAAPADLRVLAVDQSPSAGEVAVLLEPEPAAAGEWTVLIADSAGEVVKRIDATGSGAALATPIARANSAAPVVDWSPQGDRVLVAPRGESITTLSLADDEEPEVFDPEDDATIVAPAWSPTGETIAYVASSDAARQRSLRMLDIPQGTVADIVDAADGRVVVEFAWMPDGVSLLFTEGGSAGGVSGIDLWRIDADGQNRELIASAGTVAPVAQITRVRPSPDGRAVAYAVLVPGADGPRVDSVWVRDLESRIGFSIALPSVASVDDIWWTDQGLVIQITTTATPERPEATQALLLVGHDGAVRALWAAPVSRATPIAATPGATPAAR